MSTPTRADYPRCKTCDHWPTRYADSVAPGRSPESDALWLPCLNGYSVSYGNQTNGDYGCIDHSDITDRQAPDAPDKLNTDGVDWDEAELHR